MKNALTKRLDHETSRMRASDGFNPFPLAIAAAIGMAGYILIASSAGADVPSAARAAVLVAVLVFGVWVGWVDARSHRIPDAVTIPMAAAVVAGVTTCTLLTGDWALAGQALLASVALGIMYLVAAIAGGLGLGDVKLAAILGLALGFNSWTTVLWGGLLGLVFALPHALVVRKTRRLIPLGPYMAAGAIAALAADLVKEWMVS